jgi:adenosylcobinamide amidohydrolase
LAVVSSAVVGGELAQTQHILNVAVPANYQSDSHEGLLSDTASGLGVSEPFVGLLTAARLDRVQVVSEPVAGALVVAVVTLGIRYPTAAGVTLAPEFKPTAGPGTINIVLLIEGRLPPSARVNAVITATEAKALALFEAGVVAPHGGPASGTGTDSVVVASTERGDFHEYAGPIAPLGAHIGRAVRRAIQAAIAIWRAG